MSDERRYSDDEVAEIFALAARTDEPTPREIQAESGLTLRELQEVAKEVGIHPDRIAEAAGKLVVATKVLPQKNFLGAPLTVGRVVDLPRALSEREWDIIVGDLRDTFAATGRLRTLGAAREWANGNLRVLLEPTETGHRLRLTTLNSRFRFLGGYGVVMVLFVGIMAATVLVPLIATGGFTAEALASLVPSAAAAIAGVGAITWARTSLPKWAEERSAQMEMIAQRVQALAERIPSGEGI
jgi:hypothetical protein